MGKPSIEDRWIIKPPHLLIVYEVGTDITTCERYFMITIYYRDKESGQVEQNRCDISLRDAQLWVEKMNCEYPMLYHWCESDNSDNESLLESKT